MIMWAQPLGALSFQSRGFIKTPLGHVGIVWGCTFSCIMVNNMCSNYMPLKGHVVVRINSESGMLAPQFETLRTEVVQTDRTPAGLRTILYYTILYYTTLYDAIRHYTTLYDTRRH